MLFGMERNDWTAKTQLDNQVEMNIKIAIRVWNDDEG